MLQLLISDSVLCAESYESWLAVDKITATIIRLTFCPTLYT